MNIASVSVIENYASFTGIINTKLNKKKTIREVAATYNEYAVTMRTDSRSINWYDYITWCYVLDDFLFSLLMILNFVYCRSKANVVLYIKSQYGNDK